jgi:hypothetical protein
VITFKDNQLDHHKFKLNTERTIYFNNNENLEKLLNNNTLDIRGKDIQIKSLNMTEGGMLDETGEEYIFYIII